MFSNRMQLIVGLGVGSVLLLLWNDTIRNRPEPYEPAKEDAVDLVMQGLESRGVRIGTNGLSSVEVIDTYTGPATREGMLNTLLGRPAYKVDATARLSLTTQGGDVIKTPPFTVRGHGETRELAASDASSGVQAIADEFVARARIRGLLISR